jgi:nucleoside-diphosphate-sugar epimerase
LAWRAWQLELPANGFAAYPKNMKLFVTGASGYIGQVVVEHAVKAGHTVEGLARNEDSVRKVERLGATPVVGDLGSSAVLAAAAMRADAVLHLAYTHDFSLDYSVVIDIEVKAVAALVEGAGRKPVVTTSGTAVVAPAPDGGETNEDSVINEGFVLGKRIHAERAVLKMAEQGAHTVAVRLPPYVYGRGGSFFVPALMQQAAKHGVSAWVDGPRKRTSDVDVDDVARFYLLAAQAAPAGALYNCTGETDISTEELAQAVGEALGVPARSLPRTEVQALWGEFLTDFVDYDNRPSSGKARRELGWHPQAAYGLLEDIVKGSYRELAARLRVGQTA